MKNYLAAAFLLMMLCLSQSSCFTDPTPITPPDEEVITYANPAIQDVSEQIEYNPNDPELYVTRASLFYEAEAYEDAIKDMQKAMSFDSSSISNRHILADVYFDAEMDNEAMGLLEETITLFPASEPTLLKLAEFQQILSLNEAALATIGKLMDVTPEHVEGYYMYGKIHAQMGQDAKATANYNKALAKNPKHFDSLLELGTFYNNKTSKKALPLLKRAYDLSPNNPDIIFELGNYYRFHKNDDKALEHYKQATLLDYQYTEAHINAGLVWFMRDSFERAAEFFNMAVEVDPLSPDAYYNRGLSKASLGKVASAKADFKQVLIFIPNHEDAKKALEALEALGE